jgi:hypothetical protein
MQDLSRKSKSKAKVLDDDEQVEDAGSELFSVQPYRKRMKKDHGVKLGLKRKI